jgi:hypothetical protein
LFKELKNLLRIIPEKYQKNEDIGYFQPGSQTERTPNLPIYGSETENMKIGDLKK